MATYFYLIKTKVKMFWRFSSYLFILNDCHHFSVQQRWTLISKRSNLEVWVVSSMHHVNRKIMKFITINCVGSRRINVTCSSRAITVTVPSWVFSDIYALSVVPCIDTKPQRKGTEKRCFYIILKPNFITIGWAVWYALIFKRTQLSSKTFYGDLFQIFFQRQWGCCGST